MKLYRMRCYDHDQGEVIRWFATRKEAMEAYVDHSPYGGCGPGTFFEFKVSAVSIPETQDKMLAWLNKNAARSGR